MFSTEHETKQLKAPELQTPCNNEVGKTNLETNTTPVIELSSHTVVFQSLEDAVVPLYIISNQ